MVTLKKPWKGLLPCQWCDGSMWCTPTDRCTRCTEDGTEEWSCGSCCQTFHLGNSLHPLPVIYEWEGRELRFCSHCAPAEAIGDGEILRAIIRDVRKLVESARDSVALGHARSVEAALLDLCALSGVEGEPS